MSKPPDVALPVEAQAAPPLIPSWISSRKVGDRGQPRSLHIQLAPGPMQRQGSHYRQLDSFTCPLDRVGMLTILQRMEALEARD
jgi:hypothetical protein